MRSFMLWVDISEELLWCQCEGKSAVGKGDPYKQGSENASASAFPVACCGVSERTTIKWINSLHFEDSLQLAAGSFNLIADWGGEM
jgi:hypothetical protein